MVGGECCAWGKNVRASAVLTKSGLGFNVACFFQHFFSGIRHLLMDLGAGYELKTNRTWAIATYIASITATGLVLLYVANRMMGA